MEITLKSIHHSSHLSQETHAFTATIYVDGKKAGTAENDGWGGQTNCWIDNKELRKKVEEHFKGLPSIKDSVGGHEFEYQPALHHEVDKRLEEHLDLKEVQRIMRKGVAFIKDKGIYTVSYRKNAHIPKPRLLELVREKQKGRIILQDVPKNELLKVVKEKTDLFEL